MSLSMDDLKCKTVVTDQNCWEWQGKRGRHSRNRYGHVQYAGERYLCHRLAWEFSNNTSIPHGVFICHSCDNRSCINPDHLFLGTPKDNMYDCIAKGRHKFISQRQKGSVPLNPFPKGNSIFPKKLTAKDVSDARKEFSSGLVTYRFLANRYSVNPGTMYDAIHRKTWKSVP